MNEKQSRYENDPIPATGAWQVGDAVGNRMFFEMEPKKVLALEGGGSLRGATVAYEAWGTLNAEASNAILLCHALTGDSHVIGSSGSGHPSEGWWEPLVGPGKTFDTDRFFIVCANVLGGCQGTTGPSSINPETDKPYGSAFPVVTIRDTVRSQALLADHLEIDKWLAVVGGSVGGMQVLEWALMFPQRVGAIATLASAYSASPLQIGWSQVGRLAIALDPKWRGGNYYHADDGDGPHQGLMLARRIAHLHYRSDASLSDKFARSWVDPLYLFEPWDRFQVESYLDYQGQKLARRFDANSYILLNKAMDLFDVTRGRGRLKMALQRIKCPTLVASITSDMLYPPRQQEELRDGLQEAGVDVSYHVIDSDHGHDAFLVEYEQVEAFLRPFIDKIS